MEEISLSSETLHCMFQTFVLYQLSKLTGMRTIEGSLVGARALDSGSDTEGLEIVPVFCVVYPI